MSGSRAGVAPLEPLLASTSRKQRTRSITAWRFSPFAVVIGAPKSISERCYKQ